MHESLKTIELDFVLLDDRAPSLYVQSHVPGALSLPHGKMIESKMANWSKETLSIVQAHIVIGPIRLPLDWQGSGIR